MEGQPAINGTLSILPKTFPVKCSIIIVGLLSFSFTLSGQGSTLPNPDRFPADSLIVMLQEDTVANQFKAWAINRTDYPPPPYLRPANQSPVYQATRLLNY
jgi:hypothetical protein